MKKTLQKAVILPLIVVIALALVIFKVKSKPPLAHEEMQFPVKTVEVITASKIPFRARSTAYGNVEPFVLVQVIKNQISG